MIPRVRAVQFSVQKIHAAEHRVHIRQEAGQAAFRELRAQRYHRMARVLALSACQLTAGEQTADGELHIGRTALPDLVDLRDQRQHPVGDIFSLLEPALSDRAVGNSHTVPA